MDVLKAFHDINKLEEASKKAEVLSYPDVVKGKFWKINVDYSRPCVSFNKAKATSHDKYPFEINYYSGGKTESRLVFLNKEDAGKWPKATTVRTMPYEFTAVRIDDDADIPVYADIEWVKRFKSLPQCVKDRLNKKAVPNPFEDLKAKEATKDAREAFKTFLETEYDIKWRYDDKSAGYIPIEKIAGDSYIYDKRVRANSWGTDQTDAKPFYIELNQNNYLFYVRCISRSKNFLYSEDLVNKLRDINLKFSYEQNSLFENLVNRRCGTDNFHMSSYSPGQFYFMYDVQKGSEEFSVKGEIKDAVVSFEYRLDGKHTGKYDNQLFQKKVDILKGLVNSKRFYGYWEDKFKDFVMNYDEKKENELMHIPAKRVLYKGYDSDISENILSEQDKEEMSDWLLENAQKELMISTNENCSALTDVFLKTLFEDKNIDKDFWHWYIFLKEELDLDLFKILNYDVKKFAHDNSCININCRGKDPIVLPAELFSIPNRISFCISKVRDVYIEDGVTTLGNITFYSSGEPALHIPQSFTGSIKYEQVCTRWQPLVLMFTPVPGKDGELQSSFTVPIYTFDLLRENLVLEM